MKIDFLSMPGCQHCADVREVLKKVGTDYPGLEIEEHDVTKEPEIVQKYMLMSAPGIVVDGKLEFTGGVEESKLRARLDKG